MDCSTGKMKKISCSVDTTPMISVRKRNQLLTEEEKREKKKLKRGIKIQAKIKTLRTRIKHSIHRKDPIVEANAREELMSLFDKERNLLKELGLSFDTVPIHEPTTTEEAQSLILEISSELFNSKKARESLDSKGKQRQLDDGVKLLRHMTKGTQDISMFHNQSCWGYCRQKFYGRALLLCQSLYRLIVSQENLDSILDCKPDDEKSEIMFQHKQRQDMYIRTKSVQRVFSIGCGPGNDAVGLITFLRMIHGDRFDGLRDLILLDWSIDAWRESTLETLQCILHDRKLVKSILTEYCDVTKDMTNGLDRKIKDIILLPPSKEDEVDIFLISYLLSETRDKWSTFFTELIHISRPGSLFYFAEPIPWQLHQLIQMFEQDLIFAWIDSSRDNPSLQKLNGRTGPAVLFAKRK